MALNVVERIDEQVRVRTALISVWDKAGLESFVKGLVAACPELRIISTGGTYTAIEKALGPDAPGILAQVSQYTGQPEMQGGLVKTLDFRIYLGLLSETYNPAHTADLKRTGALAIDMVVVNLYPFQKTIEASGATAESARGNIDIGGPCMTRAAAKNFHRVAAVTDPSDYPGIVRELGARKGSLSLETRFRLSRKAFRLTAGYDAAIAAYLEGLSLDDMRSCYRVED